MAAHDVNLADADAEVVGHELADGNIGLVVDWGGYDADDETAGSMLAHLVPASPGDHSHLETLVVTAHEPQPYAGSQTTMGADCSLTLSQVRANRAMLAAVWAAISGSTAANTSMPWDVPITTRHCALTPARSSSR